MIHRCTDPTTERFNNYGARGIDVCVQWKNPKIFYDWAIANGWRQGLQIDRIDNDGNYEPSNCHFVTLRENCSNRAHHSEYGVGVRKDSRNPIRPFVAHARVNSKYKHIGCFKTASEASAAREEFLRKEDLL